MLIPTALVGTFSFLTPYAVAIPIIVLQTARDPASKSYDISVILVEWVHIFFVLYTILFPIICFWRNSSLRSCFFKSLPHFALKWLNWLGWREISIGERNKRVENANEYFAVLATFWQ